MSDSRCRSRNCPRFDPSILRHSGISGAADETVLNKVHLLLSMPSSPPPPDTYTPFLALPPPPHTHLYPFPSPYPPPPIPSSWPLLSSHHINMPISRDFICGPTNTYICMGPDPASSHILGTNFPPT